MDGRWIAATTTLIHGINAKNVGGTIFCGVPYGLINLYQGSGRGGRDGRKSWSILLDAQRFRKKELIQDTDPTCKKEAVDWISNNECRRLPFSRLFDGAEVCCSALKGSHDCDHCSPNSLLLEEIQKILMDPATPLTTNFEDPFLPLHNEYDEYNDSILTNDTDLDSIPALGPVSIQSSLIPPSLNEPTLALQAIIPQQFSHQPVPPNAEPSVNVLRDAAFATGMLQVKANKAAFLQQVCTVLQYSCAICFIHTGKIKPLHQKVLGKECGIQGYQKNISGWMDLKKLIRFPEYMYCYRCQLPLQDQYRPSQHSTTGSGDCSFDDFIIKIIWYIRQRPVVWTLAKAAFSTLGSNPTNKEFASWLGRHSGPDCFWNGLELVLWYLKQRKLVSV